MYERIKNNYHLECDHATKEYQMFTDTCKVHYGDYDYYIKHTSVEHFYDLGEEDVNELFISRRKTENWLNEDMEDVYYCKYHNRSVDWIELATDFIENDYPHTETESDDIF